MQCSRKVNLQFYREAFNKGDADASMLLHDAKRHAPEQHGGSGSDYVKSIVFGGLDGIITTFGMSLPYRAFVEC